MVMVFPVCISYENFKAVDQEEEEEDSDDCYDIDDANRHWDTFEASSLTHALTNSCVISVIP
jgi:hypothetical protein